MSKLMKTTVSLLVIAMLSGCSAFQSMRTWIIGIQTHDVDADKEEYRKIFEEGRRAEEGLVQGIKYNISFADMKYMELIRKGDRYGEYGRAKLLLNFGDEEQKELAVRYLISCAERSSFTSKFYPDNAMDTAFSIAAMAELARIAMDDAAMTDDKRREVVDSLYTKMSEVDTKKKEEVGKWADEMKMDRDSERIYKDVILAVKSEYPFCGSLKKFEWEEILAVLVNGDVKPVPPRDEGRTRRPPTLPYQVVRSAQVKRTDSMLEYEFEIRLSGSLASDVEDRIKFSRQRYVKREFLAAHPSFSDNDVSVIFSSWRQSESAINCSVVAAPMKMEVVRREYNKITGKGKVGVRLGDNDVAAAEKLAIENIEAIATRHNILNVAGDLPPKGAQYTVIKSGTTEDGLFEIEFKCE